MAAQGTTTTVSHKKSSEVRRDASVRHFLERLALAVTRGDDLMIATMWDVPALVLGEGLARPLETSAEVEAFFRAAKARHDACGISSARVEIEQLEWSSERIAVAHVRWSYFGENERAIGVERSTYVLRRDHVGTLKVQVLMLEAAEAAPSPFS